jgi:hypothetical protein
MRDLATLKVGDKVYYQPKHYQPYIWENGMIKEIPDFATDPDAENGYNCVRVVYHCCGDWLNFDNYTSALTNIKDLTEGWRH